MVSLSTAPLPSTATTVAAVGESATTCTERTATASAFGPTMTAA